MRHSIESYLFTVEYIFFFSVTMVIMWMCGDIFKTIYFILREAPVQFWVCGSLQVAVDIAILLQVYFYNNVEPKRSMVHPD